MRLRQALIALAVTQVLFAAAPAGAQHDGDIEDVSVEDILDLDLSDKLGETESASRNAEAVLRAPARVTTINYEQIRLAGANSIPELLRWVPGVHVARVASGNYIVSMRGASGVTGNNVVVMIDGNPINQVGDGGVDWGLIAVHPADLDRIEVVSGPVSTIYGANAYTGVINLVTRGVIGESPSYAARLQAGGDSDVTGLSELSARYLYHQGKLQAAVYTRGTYDQTSGETASGDDNPALRMFGAAMRLRYQATEASAMSVGISASTGSRSAANHLVVEATDEKPTVLMANAKYERTSTGTVSSASVWAQEIYGRTGAGTGMDTGFSYAGTAWNRLSVGTDLSLRFGPKLTGRVTAQGNADWLNAPYIHPNENHKLRLAFGLGGGLRYAPHKTIDLSTEVRADESPMTGRVEMSFRGGAVYHTGKMALRATAASAYRSPTYVEVGARLTDPATGLIALEGTPGLDSPRSDSAELSAIVSPSYDLTIAPTVYYARYSNLMIQDFEPLVRRSFRNDDQARALIGAEVNFDWRMNPTLWVHGSLGVVEFLDDSTAMTTIAVPDQNPRLIGGARVRGTALRGELGFGAGALYTTSRTYRSITGIPPVVLAEELPSYALIDAMVEYHPTPAMPLWVSLRARTTAPSTVRESAVPSAGQQATTVLFGLEYRTE